MIETRRGKGGRPAGEDRPGLDWRREGPRV